ncbi:polysaccharide deacetylase family protein [Salegentibacter salegens]|uniref:Peptidoglycan/xylan/chitin deacetylase, PgdA/CDA1 family n=2 Tax=Salegentibacter salegens TaxID=143223 RepID=A0A1M7LRI7_9FLAO|nr:polysaccharide deacetylase family protein [Salegentibacter salegens]PRX52217.1 peptidoglycan/xylan/chitin deacetylase (PgdA/CDA1 family) [Salegentibacter salegens]SHM80818.1 Peptidoglycan/xylan/chitin deacetylase, PgdA/CDA1 family [Salegentibacter salegens]
MNPFFIKYPSILRKLYPNRITRLKDKKSIYLTFDDGPIPEITPWVLEQLKQYNAKATFFCIGDNIKKNPEVFQQLIQEEHSIGNHTFNHLNGWKTKTEAYVKNVHKTEEIFLEHRKKRKKREEGRNYKNQPQESKGETQENAKLATRNSQPETSTQKLFRPPYGKIKNSQATELVKLNYKIVMWDVLSGDFENRISKEKCFKNVIQNASEGSTVVFHDSQKAFKNLQYTLPKVLEYYAEKGFSFKSI